MTEKKKDCWVCGLNPWLVKLGLLAAPLALVVGAAGIFTDVGKADAPAKPMATIIPLTPQGMWVTFTPTPTMPVPAPTEPVAAREPVIREIVREVPVIVPAAPPVVVTVIVPVVRVGLTPVATMVPSATPVPPTPVCGPHGWQRNGRCP